MARNRKRECIRISMLPQDIQLLQELMERDLRRYPGDYITALVRREALQLGMDTDEATKEFGISGVPE